MPGWLINFFIGLVFSAIAAMLRPKPQPPKSATLDDFNIPVTKEGLEVGKVYGTVWLRAPQVVDYGDFLSTPITTRQGKK